MDVLTHKTHKTTRNFTYSYYVQLSASKPTLFFIHGWPDSAELWSAQIAHFSALGYGIVAVDCLGYAGTSKPSDPEAYNSEGMAGDIVDILDAEGLDKVIVVGHDWGSFLTGRVGLWYPEKVLGSIYLDVADRPPVPMDLEQFLAMIRKTMGYEAFSYTLPTPATFSSDNLGIGDSSVARRPRGSWKNTSSLSLRLYFRKMRADLRDSSAIVELWSSS
jgi:soluble epoxide hydrolase / lipid-phosphate phosphatase